MIGEDDVITTYQSPNDGVIAYEDHTVVFDPDRLEVPVQNITCNHMLLLHRNKTGEEIAVTLPALIGRGSKVDAKISGNLAISREHAMVGVAEERFMLRDLGSSNGTRVNGFRITPGTNYEIHDGDVIYLASESFIARMR